MSEQTQKKKRSGTFLRKLWVPFVLIMGLVLGELISYGSTGPPGGEEGFGQGPGPFGGHFPQEHFPQDPLFGLHIVFTTIEVALLISLVVIYVKMYAETRASFALGLVVVLGAFLLQALLAYPLIDGLFGEVSMGPGLFSLSIDLVTICAYTVFLYLSLG